MWGSPLFQQHQSIKVVLKEKFASKEGTVNCEEACLVIEGPVTYGDPTRCMLQAPSCDAHYRKWVLGVQHCHWLGIPQDALVNSSPYQASSSYCQGNWDQRTVGTDTVPHLVDVDKSSRVTRSGHNLLVQGYQPVPCSPSLPACPLHQSMQNSQEVKHLRSLQWLYTKRLLLIAIVRQITPLLYKCNSPVSKKVRITMEHQLLILIEWKPW